MGSGILQMIQAVYVLKTTEFLELFLRNLLLNENHSLHNRTLHISGTFREIEKPGIETIKSDIRAIKVDIEKIQFRREGSLH